ncbi:hypothetical protein EH2_00053 [Bacillus subtilis]|nr:hypothetical protein EH2_00053 [Bacillus subtilis]
MVNVPVVYFKDQKEFKMAGVAQKQPRNKLKQIILPQREDYYYILTKV